MKTLMSTSALNVVETHSPPGMTMVLFVEPPSTSIESLSESGRDKSSFSPKQPAKDAENMRKTNIPARV